MSLKLKTKVMVDNELTSCRVYCIFHVYCYFHVEEAYLLILLKSSFFIVNKEWFSKCWKK